MGARRNNKAVLSEFHLIFQRFNGCVVNIFINIKFQITHNLCYFMFCAHIANSLRIPLGLHQNPFIKAQNRLKKEREIFITLIRIG